MKNYLIHTYGCQMNVHESEKIAGILENKGYCETKNENHANIIVFNTCCIRETAEEKVYGHLGRLKRLKEQKTDLIVAVCGCMSQQKGAAEILKKKFPFIDIILGTSNLHLLEDAVPEPDKNCRVKLIDNEFYADNDDLPVFRSARTNAWVNIIYGCDNFCTYCIVPYVRGRERSRSPESIYNEVSSLFENGYKEITLLGQNVNSYGKDLGNGVTFSKLLETLGKIEGKHRIRFMTSHPRDFTADIVSVIKKYPNLCNNIHLPVQSGSDRILDSMNRHYTINRYLDLVKEIRTELPGVGLTTDIMVGFPGETEEDFQSTLELVNTVRFSGAFCFVYSRRKGTPGYLMENQVSPEIKKDRIKRLLSLQNKITKEISKDHEGKIFEILVEDRNEKIPQVFCGRTEGGRLVNFKSETDVLGKFVDVKILSSNSATLWGDLVTEEK